MIIYGTKAKQLKQETLMEKCPNCGTQNAVDMYIFQKYAHVFWIPFFPVNKVAATQCSNCKQLLKQKEFTPDLRLAASNLKSQVKTPLFTFIGLAALIVLISFAVVEGREKDKRNASLIQHPQKGDVFEVKTSEGQYTLYKVAEVTKDSAFVFMCQYESNKATNLSALLQKPFTEDVFGFSIKELIAMQAKGDILDISRR